MVQKTTKADSAAIFDANRAHGRIALSVIERDGRTHRQQVDEAGSYRIRFPNTDGLEAEAVILNTAGGVQAAMTSPYRSQPRSGARLSVTTAAAEKIYRVMTTPARMSVTLSAAPGAVLRWLPQETILFDKARLHRTIDVEFSERASLLMAEAVIFGRTAMNEGVHSGELVDRWRIRRNGRLAFAETLRLTGGKSIRCSRGQQRAMVRSRSRPWWWRPATTVLSRRCGRCLTDAAAKLRFPPGTESQSCGCVRVTRLSCGAIWFRCSMP